MSEVVLVSTNLAGANLSTFIQRVINECRRATDDDVDAIKMAMISAIRHFEPLRLWFREKTETFDLTIDQQSYQVATASIEGYPADYITPKDVYILVGGTRWLPIYQRDIDTVRWLTPTDTVVGIPTHWAWWNDKIWLTPIPSDAGVGLVIDSDPDPDLEQPVRTSSLVCRLDYFADIGTPSYSWDGVDWVFKGPNGEDLTNNWQSPWIGTNAEELIRARVKWDLYFNYYHDSENAIKMGGVDGDGGYVAAALGALYRKHNRKKYNVPRQAIRI